MIKENQSQEVTHETRATLTLSFVPARVALGLQGSGAVGGGVPAPLVCGDASVLKRAGNLRVSVCQDEASLQLFFFFALSAAGASWHT